MPNVEQVRQELNLDVLEVTRYDRFRSIVAGVGMFQPKPLEFMATVQRALGWPVGGYDCYPQNVSREPYTGRWEYRWDVEASCD